MNFKDKIKLYKEFRRTGGNQDELIKNEIIKHGNHFDNEKEPVKKAYELVSYWIETSEKTIVLEFYESVPVDDIREAVKVLRMEGETELACMIEKGIHEYRDPQYRCVNDYPEDCLNDCFEIDVWIRNHKEQLKRWM